MENVTRKSDRGVTFVAPYKRLWVAILLVVALGACSTPTPADIDREGVDLAKGSTSEAAGDDARTKAGASERAVAGPLGPLAQEKRGVRDPAADSAVTSSVLPLSKHVEIGPGFARVVDPKHDASKQGVTPEYAELVEASVIHKGSDLELSLTFADDIPEQMPAKTYMAISWTVAPKENDQDAYSFSAYSSPKGWDTFAGKDGQIAHFNGRFEVDGNRLVMTISWDEFGGPTKLKWHADTSWLLYEDDNTQRTSVDAAPNDGPGAFEG
jgi:hypothetical protein